MMCVNDFLTALLISSWTGNAHNHTRQGSIFEELRFVHAKACRSSLHSWFLLNICQCIISHLLWWFCSLQESLKNTISFSLTHCSFRWNWMIIELLSDWKGNSQLWFLHAKWCNDPNLWRFCWCIVLAFYSSTMLLLLSVQYFTVNIFLSDPISFDW